MVLKILTISNKDNNYFFTERKAILKREAFLFLTERCGKMKTITIKDIKSHGFNLT